MTAKNYKPQDNLNMCVKTVLRSAKKRRALALMAVKTLNSDLEIRPVLRSVK